VPRQECYKMDEGLCFVARLVDDEKMAALCQRGTSISWLTARRSSSARYSDGRIVIFVTQYSVSGWGTSQYRELFTYKVLPKIAPLATPARSAPVIGGNCVPVSKSLSSLTT
jgi:hypothetical protein